MKPMSAVEAEAVAADHAASPKAATMAQAAHATRIMASTSERTPSGCTVRPDR